MEKQKLIRKYTHDEEKKASKVIESHPRVYKSQTIHNPMTERLVNSHYFDHSPISEVGSQISFGENSVVNPGDSSRITSTQEVEVRRCTRNESTFKPPQSAFVFEEDLSQLSSSESVSLESL